MPSIEESLCTRCGLCCNGSLFADVELASARESSRMEMFGLEIDDEDHLLLQPCAAQKNKRCTIYSFRPKCCRTFECGLLRRVKNGWLSLNNALEQIRRFKKAPQSRKEILQRTFLT